MLTNKMYFDPNSPGSRRPIPILCEDLWTVRGQVLVEFAADRVGFRGVDSRYTNQVCREGRSLILNSRVPVHVQPEGQAPATALSKSD